MVSFKSGSDVYMHINGSELFRLVSCGAKCKFVVGGQLRGSRSVCGTVAFSVDSTA